MTGLKGRGRGGNTRQGAQHVRSDRSKETLPLGENYKWLRWLGQECGGGVARDEAQRQVRDWGEP